jgi:hypothetical protein
MDFKDKWTTNEKINIEAADKEKEEKIETKKTILSNDAYAVGEVVELLSKELKGTLESLRGLLVK